jgi:hypothetical protein
MRTSETLTSEPASGPSTSRPQPADLVVAGSEDDEQRLLKASRQLLERPDGVRDALQEVLHLGAEAVEGVEDGLRGLGHLVADHRQFDLVEGVFEGVVQVGEEAVDAADDVIGAEQVAHVFENRAVEAGIGIAGTRRVGQGH